MKASFTTSILLLAPMFVSAQVTTLPIAPPQPSYNELKKFLNLNDAQLQSLQSVQTSWIQAQQAISSQISDKYKTLYSLLDSGGGTATQLGQLLLDIQALQKQLPVSNAPYKTQALNILTPDQKSKLPTLSQALQLQTPAWQAINLLLIDSPYLGVPVPVGIGVPAVGPNLITSRVPPEVVQ